MGTTQRMLTAVGGTFAALTVMTVTAGAASADTTVAAPVGNCTLTVLTIEHGSSVTDIKSVNGVNYTCK